MSLGRDAFARAVECMWSPAFDSSDAEILWNALKAGDAPWLWRMLDRIITECVLGSPEHRAPALGAQFVRLAEMLLNEAVGLGRAAALRALLDAVARRAAELCDTKSAALVRLTLSRLRCDMALVG